MPSSLGRCSVDNQSRALRGRSGRPVPRAARVSALSWLAVGVLFAAPALAQQAPLSDPHVEAMTGAPAPGPDADPAPEPAAAEEPLAPPPSEALPAEEAVELPQRDSP